MSLRSYERQGQCGASRAAGTIAKESGSKSRKKFPAPSRSIPPSQRPLNMRAKKLSSKIVNLIALITKRWGWGMEGMVRYY